MNRQSILFDDGPQMPVAVVPKVYQVLHLGDMNDPKFGTIEEMSEEQYREFVEANTWPHPHSKANGSVPTA